MSWLPINIIIILIISVFAWLQTRELHKIGVKEEEERFSRLTYLPMDLNTMEAKCKARKYKYLEQFHADAQTIHHNVYICFGG